MHRRIALSTALLTPFLGLPGASAQQDPFVGSWQGVASVNGMQITFILLLRADVRFSEQQMMVQHPAMPPLMTMQTGRYGFSAALQRGVSPLATTGSSRLLPLVPEHRCAFGESSS